MKKLLTILCTIIAASLSVMAVTPRVVTTATEKIRKAPALTATFRVNGADGKLVMSGSRFMLTLPGMTTAYDGITQRTLNEADGELTLSTPTAEELATVNPLAFLGALNTAFTATQLKDGRVVFSPKDKTSGIDKITANFDPQTSMPTLINMKAAGGEALIDNVKVVFETKVRPTSQFAIKVPKNIEIIDLR